MAQQLIAINGNEEFPYTLQASDISLALGFAEGISPGGLGVQGILLTNNDSGLVQLDDSAWNNGVQIADTVTEVTLPTNSPTGATIHFYPNTIPSNPYATWTLSVTGTNQYIYMPDAGYSFQTTSIQVPYNATIVVVSRGFGEMDIVGGSYQLTNTLNTNVYLGGAVYNPLNLGRSNATNKNLILNGTWIYGANMGWKYPSGLNYGTGITASGVYLYVNGPASTSFTITSNELSLPYNTVGNQYMFSGLIINQGENSSGDNDTNSTHDVIVYLNLYNSEKSLLTSTKLITAPAGNGWTFYQSPVIVLDSTNAGASYATIVITGQTYDQAINIAMTEFKLESVYNNGVPTFFSDETSTAIFGNNTLSGNGYQQLPSGLIMQWGIVTNTGQSGSTPATATFPLAFPNGCFQVVMTDSGPDDYRYYSTSYSTTGFEFGAMATDASGTATWASSGSANGRFIAFGW